MDIRRERELIEQARNGFDGAYRQLVEANMRNVYGLALRYTGRHEDADEAAQETFIRAYRALDRFQGDARFSTWIYRIAVNCCLSLRRKRGRKEEFEVSGDSNDMPLGTSEPTQERLAISGQTRELVHKALDTLSDRQRSVFVMKHLQHKKISEIAEILEIAEGTVKQQLFRAVRKVREFLAPHVGREEVAQ